MTTTTPRFPADFIWGVATASYQIEGAVNEDGRGPCIWDTFSATPGAIDGGDTGAVACDHYHRWADDVDLMQRLGVDAYRFSIAWPRVIPAGTGAVNQAGLDFYDRLVDGLLERGIAPFATLYHWDLPQPLQDAGGWPERSIVDAFVAYADAVTRRLGDRVAAYATMNEPWCSAVLGYALGDHAPGLREPALAPHAAHHLLLAHGAALEVMRANAPAAQHGIVLNFNPAYPATDTPADIAAAKRFDGFFNRWFIEALLEGRYPSDVWEGYGAAVPDVRAGDLETISRPLDFLGVNYYTRIIATSDLTVPWPSVRAVPFDGTPTDMGWEVYPQGMTELLLHLQREYAPPPMYVTENGAAYADVLHNGTVDDAQRIGYLEQHVAAVHAAIEGGADVRGYFAWSLLDNFEWARGYAKRFGLVYVDYETQARVPKRSASWYAGLIARHRAAPLVAAPQAERAEQA